MEEGHKCQETQMASSRHSLGAPEGSNSPDMNQGIGAHFGYLTSRTYDKILFCEA